MAERRQRAPLAGAMTAAVEQLERLGLADQTVRAVEKTWARFGRFAADGHSICDVGAIDAAVVRGFVEARTAGGSAPSTPAMHWRRSVIRLLFRIWRGDGVECGDPTLDLSLPHRSTLLVRPLDDEEIALCRWASLTTPGTTRLPAVWALAEAGATSGEIPNVLVREIDLETGKVSLSGSTKTEPRTVPLTDWGATQLARRVEAPGHRRGERVAYQGTGSPESAQASVSGAVGDVLRRAGFASEPDIRPRSVTAWVGRKVFDETGHIEDVARRLGLRSLDRAAALIGWWEWRV
ncbi:MAG: tyrosine-type recombinase/integrase [Actinomycetota bacterium]